MVEHKLGKQPAHTLFDAVTIVDDLTSAEIAPQRLADENGSFVCAVSADPTGVHATLPYIGLEARLHPDAPWVEVTFRLFVDFDTSNKKSLTIANRRVYPRMRAVLHDPSTDAALVGITCTVYFVE